MTRNPYKFRGPETWALAREAYLAGETAGSIADRLDVTVSALRRRAYKQGWTRRDHARAIDAAHVRRGGAAGAAARAAAQPPAAVAEPASRQPEPTVIEPESDPSAAEVARQAVRASARAMANGEFAKAALVLKTAESIARLVAVLPALDPDGAVTRSPRDAEPVFVPERNVWDVLREQFGLPTEKEEWAAKAAYLATGKSPDDAEQAVRAQWIDRYTAAEANAPQSGAPTSSEGAFLSTHDFLAMLAKSHGLLEP